jgi:hypothetical protein
MQKTSFMGLTALDPTDSIYDENAVFLHGDRLEIDRGMRIGIKTHRHTGADGLLNPDVAPSAATLASGGVIPPDLIMTFGYTLQDDQQGETELSPAVTISSPPPIEIPQYAPSAEVQYSGGTLMANSYYYATTFADGDGGETPLGPPVAAEREPGFASGQVLLTNLDEGMAEAGAVGWRLYRSIGGGLYGLLATGGIGEDSYLDDGTPAPDCNVHPPADGVNTTLGTSRVEITLPEISQSASFINLYGTISGDFTGAALLAQYPIASAGESVIFETLDFLDSSPPDTNRSYGGAPKIDPDVEILDWHWKRPVASASMLADGEQGDVRLSLSERKLYGVFGATAEDAADWDPIAGGGGASGTSAAIRVEDGTNVVDPAEILEFIGSGGITVGVAEPLAGVARITIGGAGGAMEERAWASATLNLASGASGSTPFEGGAGIRLMRVSTNKRARVRAYGDEEALLADVARAIGTDPAGDHGVQLDYANTTTASGGIHRITPLVDVANLDEPEVNQIYLNITNYDADGDVVVAFLYIPTEVT